MKILFLDDDRSRHAKRFLQKGDDDLRQVWNAADCIEALKEGDWDVCSLDHDLEGIYQTPEDENTGSGVVRWIVANKPDVQMFVVHSYNQFEAPKMVESLKSAGYSASWKPFNL